MRFTFCPLFSGSSGNALFIGGGDTRILIDAGMPGKALKDWMTKGAYNRWQAIYGGMVAPDDSSPMVADFFSHALLLTGREDAQSGIYALYNPLQDNIMLTDSEESLADEAETKYYEGLSAEEREYLGIEEDTLRKLFEQYALAQKVYKSVGTSFEERYDSFCTTLDYDLNEKLWDTVALADIPELTETPGCSEVYAKYFGNSYLGQETREEEEIGQ